MVVMAIMAVVVGAGLFAMGYVTKASRDEDRKIGAASITKLVDDYFRTKGVYPRVTVGELVWSVNRVQVGTKETELKGYHSYSASSTDSNHTRYVYSVRNDGYLLCVLLENGNWFKLGTSAGSCP